MIPWLALGISDAFKDRGDDFYLAESGHLSNEYLIDTLAGFGGGWWGFLLGSVGVVGEWWGLHMKTAQFLSLLAVSLCSWSLEGQAEDYVAQTFSGEGGKTLGYRLLAPAKMEEGKKYPLVLFLHGAGERGSDNGAQLKHGASLFLKAEVREKFPCFVLAPQCPNGQTWSEVKGWTGPSAYSGEPTEVMRLVMGALALTIKEQPVDGERIYVTGLSMGGYGSWDLLARYPERWAGVAPVCGGGDAGKIGVGKGVAVWAFHGVNDPTVPVIRSREMVAALVAAGGKPLYSEYPYVKHDAWTQAYGEPEFLRWLFAQKRGEKVVPFEKVAGGLAQPPSNLCPGVGPMQSGLWFRGLWGKRREMWEKDRVKDEGAVVFFGDSITQGWEKLGEAFPKWKVANRGISGDTSRGLLTRVEGDVLAVHPKAVVILIGTNDLDQGGTPEEVLANVKALVGILRKADGRMPIVVNAVMPRGGKGGLFPEKIVGLNGMLVEAFKGDERVTFCDTFGLFDAGNGQSKREEFPDMLHPNGAGYEKWAGALGPIFEKWELGK